MMIIRAPSLKFIINAWKPIFERKRLAQYKLTLDKLASKGSCALESELG